MKSIATSAVFLLAVVAIGFADTTEERGFLGGIGAGVVDKIEDVQKFLQEKANKQLIENYYQDVFVKKDLGSLGKYVDVNLISHSPTIPNGLDSLRNAFTALIDDSYTAQLLRIAANGDLVWIHRYIKANLLSTMIPGNPDGVLAVDIYRIKNQKIAEFWDVVQPVYNSTAA